MKAASVLDVLLVASLMYLSYQAGAIAGSLEVLDFLEAYR